MAVQIFVSTTVRLKPKFARSLISTINIPMVRNKFSCLLRILVEICEHCFFILLGLEHLILENLTHGNYLAFFVWLLLAVIIRWVISKLLSYAPSSLSLLLIRSRKIIKPLCRYNNKKGT